MDSISVFLTIIKNGSISKTAEELIYQRISDITISMKALDYINMPEYISTRHVVEMEEKERKLYDMMAKDLLIPLEDGDIDAANAAALTGKLLQMSNGAVYDENGEPRRIHDHKLEALKDLIEAANGQSVLIAYWFKHDRARIMEWLGNLKIPVREIRNDQDIKDWNAGEVPVALIHPASAGRRERGVFRHGAAEPGVHRGLCERKLRPAAKGNHRAAGTAGL